MAAFQRPSRVALILLALILALVFVILAFAARPAPTALAPAREAAAPTEAPAAQVMAALPIAGSGAPASAPADSATLLGLGAAPAAAPPASADAQSAQGWGSWVELPGAAITSAPAAVSWGGGRIDVFARGSSGEVVQNARDGNGGWTGWATPRELRGLVLRSAPSCASYAVNRINCVALREGYDGVHQFWWDGQRWGRNDLGGDASSAPAIVAWGGGRLSVLVRNFNGTVIHRYWRPGLADWSPPNWEPLGNNIPIFSAPACSSRAAGIIDCFAVGSGGLLMQLYYDETVAWGGRWVGWSQLPANATTQSNATPSVVGTNPLLLDVFVRGLDMRLYQLTYNGQWQRPALVDNRTAVSLVTGPGCARVGTSRIDCLGQFIDTQRDAYLGLTPLLAVSSQNRR